MNQAKRRVWRCYRDHFVLGRFVDLEKKQGYCHTCQRRVNVTLRREKRK